MTTTILIQDQSLDLQVLHRPPDHLQGDPGAQVTFTGFVRQHDYAEPITHLFIEHYPEVTEQEIRHIAQTAQEKWNISHITIVHRVGFIAVGEPIVWVCVYAKHRTDAYAANEYIMDYLKVSAPFWKKEIFQNGRANWVDAKKSDQEKYNTWN